MPARSDVGDAGYLVDHGGEGSYVDDDEYLEYTIAWDEPAPAPVAEPVVVVDDEGDTEPMRARAEHLLHAPADTWHSDPVETWQSVLDDEISERAEPPARA